jgi:hypothetical protein
MNLVVHHTRLAVVYHTMAAVVVRHTNIAAEYYMVRHRQLAEPPADFAMGYLEAFDKVLLQWSDLLPKIHQADCLHSPDYRFWRHNLYKTLHLLVA